METQPWHFRNARRQRNKRPDHRKQTADQDSDCAKASKESLRQIQFMSAQKM